MNEKLTQLLSELEAELADVREDIAIHMENNPDGVQPYASGNYDDAFEWGVEQGEMYERRDVLKDVIKRLKEALQ